MTYSDIQEAYPVTNKLLDGTDDWFKILLIIIVGAVIINTMFKFTEENKSNYESNEDEKYSTKSFFSFGNGRTKRMPSGGTTDNRQQQNNDNN